MPSTPEEMFRVAWRIVPVETMSADHAGAAFRFEVARSQSTAVMALHGELDLASADQLSQQCARLADQCGYVVLDLARVSFIDSSGAGALVTGLEQCQSRGGGLTLARASARILKVLDLTGVAKLFQVYESVPAALARR